MLARWQFWTAIALAIVAIYAYRASIESETVESPSPHKVAFVTGGSGDYWQSAVAGAQAAAEERGIELDVRMPEVSENVEEQFQILSAVSTSAVDAVIVSPLDAEGQTSIINVIAADKPVVTFDSDAPNSTRHGYVGTSNFSAGLKAGTLVKTSIPEGGKIAVLMANNSKANLADRQAGFRTRIAESPTPDESPVDQRYEIVGYFVDQGDNAECEKIIQETLSQHPDIACLVSLNARQGPVLIKVLKEQNKVGDIKVIAFDTPEETLQGVEEGVVFATIAQDPYKYGYEAIAMIDSLCRGDQRYLPVVGRGAIHVSVESLRKDDVAPFRERTESRLANKKAG